MLLLSAEAPVHGHHEDGELDEHEVEMTFDDVLVRHLQARVQTSNRLVQDVNHLLQTPNPLLLCTVL